MLPYLLPYLYILLMLPYSINQEEVRAMMTNREVYEVNVISEPQVMALMKAVTSEPSFFDSFCYILIFEVL